VPLHRLRGGRDWERLGLRQRKVVLWLDDVDRHLLSGSLTLARLEEAAAMGMVVLATLRAERYSQLRHGASRESLAPEIRSVLGWLHESHLSGIELKLRAPLDEREVEAAASLGYPAQEMKDGVGEWFIAAEALVRKLEGGDDESPEGVSIAWAAIDWARSGLDDPIPARLLRVIGRGYYDQKRPTVAASDPAWGDLFRRGVEWCTAPVVERSALLRAEPGDGEEASYRPSDYIVAWSDGAVRGAALQPMPIQTWEAIAKSDVLDDRDRRGVGFLAYSRGDVHAAIAVWRHAVEVGDEKTVRFGSFALGVALSELQDHQQAISHYRRAAEMGDVRAAHNLAVTVLKHAPDRDDVEARRWLRFAVEHGDEEESIAACATLGHLLRFDEPDEAQKLLERVIAEGEGERRRFALLDLGIALGPKRGGQFLQEAASLDVPGAHRLLGHLRKELHDDLSGAADCFRREMAIGVSPSAADAARDLMYLGRDMWESSPEEARALLESVVAFGHADSAPEAAVSLALELMESDPAQARGLLLTAAEHPDFKVGRAAHKLATIYWFDDEPASSSQPAGATQRKRRKRLLRRLRRLRSPRHA